MEKRRPRERSSRVYNGMKWLGMGGGGGVGQWDGG